MKYEEYTVEDFLEDEDFLKWAKNPTPDTDFFWKIWIQQHPEKAREIAIAKEIALSIQYKHPIQANDADLIEVLENINKGKRSKRPKNSKIIQIPFSYVLRYSAVILLFSAIGLGLWVSNHQSTNQEVKQEKPMLVHKATLKGQKVSITLPDGSHVKLNSESTLSYSSDFGKNDRILQLEGEAFFDVTHNEDNPFIIQTGNLETTVLGTSFNINAYRENAQIKVAVLRGKVRVSVPSGKLKEEDGVLLPKEMLSYEKEDGNTRKTEIEIEDIFSWKDDIILFKNANYPEIKETLERWYSVEFVKEDNLRIQEDFSGKFERTSLERVLEALNYTSHFQYHLIDNKVFITRKNHEN